jgi:hypothetical protein
VIRQYFICVQLVLANLSTLTHDVKGLHAAPREFSTFFKHRVQDLGTHGPAMLLNATPVHGPSLQDPCH